MFIFNCHFTNLQRPQYCGWVAALADKLNRVTLQSVASMLLVPLVRDLNSDVTELNVAAKNASGLLKGKLGQAEHSELVSNISAQIEERKAIRKTEKAQLVWFNKQSLILFIVKLKDLWFHQALNQQIFKLFFLCLYYLHLCPFLKYMYFY